MDTMTSTEFRKRFAKLAEPTIVTVNGHPIGRWRPLGFDGDLRPYEQWRQIRETSQPGAPHVGALRELIAAPGRK